MKKTFQILEFNKIIEKLQENSYTEYSKEKFKNLTPFLSEARVISELNETTQARIILDKVGTPSLISMEDLDRILYTANKGGMLTAAELEYSAKILRAIKNIKSFLNSCKDLNVGLAYHADELEDMGDVRKEIESCIRNERIEDNASATLRTLRRSILMLEEKAKSKAEAMLGTNKEIYAESFISVKAGHICLPVKKKYRSRVSGNVVEQSRTGETLFIEPESICKINEELQQARIEENNEEIRILYTLSSMLSDGFDVFERNRRVIEQIDYAFAKGKYSIDIDAIEPQINTKRYIKMNGARHPLLEKEICVPLNFEMEQDTKGVLITGPNTGGKTVSIKTVGLLSLMAQCGLHIPCIEADICMNSQILCDIGDGQNISENLSTFSSHISNILDILDKVDHESLVILDELGSGTDPIEGMGIAIAILEELRKSNCKFIVTTHYAEVKTYAEKTDNLINARMAFDKQTLKPLYRLELGKAGESCALYIASKLGMSEEMVKRAYKESYKEEMNLSDISFTEKNKNKEHLRKPSKIEKKKVHKETSNRADSFNIGDAVLVHPEKKIAIVCKKADEKGEILIQQKKEKRLVNHKRLELKYPADQLYPENYDMSIVFDSVENRKKRHQMDKKHQAGIEIEVEEYKK